MGHPDQHEENTGGNEVSGFNWNSEVRPALFAQLVADAMRRNEAERRAYLNSCANCIEVNVRNREMGLPITSLPEIPQREIVTDDGTNFGTVYEPFGDLLPPKLPPVVAGGSGSLVTPGAVDPQKQILAALWDLKQDLVAIKMVLGLK
jgi:hypothetical protein